MDKNDKFDQFYRLEFRKIKKKSFPREGNTVMFNSFNVVFASFISEHICIRAVDSIHCICSARKH